MFFFRDFAAVHEQVRHHWYNRDRHQERRHQRIGYRQPERQEELADDTARQTEGQEHHDGDDGCREDRYRHIPHADDNGLALIPAFLDVPRDVLQHHN